MKNVGDLAYNLKWAEARTFGHDPCSHAEHDPHCPHCRFLLAADDYADALENYVRVNFGHVGKHDRETINRLEVVAANAWRNYELVCAANYISKVTRVDAAIKANEAERKLCRARWERRMAEQSAARKRNRVDEANGVVRIQRRRKPRVRSQ